MYKFSNIIVLALTLTMLFSMFTVTAFANEDISLTNAELGWIEDHILRVSDKGKVSTDPTWVASYLTGDISKANGFESITTFQDMDDLGDIKLIYLRKGVDIEEFKSKIAKHLDGEVVLELPEVTADTTSVLQFLEGFIPIFNMFIGLLTTLIAIGMTIFTAFDIAYIAFPVVREKCEDAKISGKGTMTKQGKNGQTELRWVSDDAQFVVSECSVENGRSPWWLYFKRRIVSYIMLAIILFILLTGNIQLITNIVLNVVSGIVEVLQSLAA